MFTEDKNTEIYCLTDDFLKLFYDQMKKYAVTDRNISGKKKYHRESTMRETEVMTIMILFHASEYRCLKHYYLLYVYVNLRHLFLDLISYNLFVE